MLFDTSLLEWYIISLRVWHHLFESVTSSLWVLHHIWHHLHPLNDSLGVSLDGNWSCNKATMAHNIQIPLISVSMTLHFHTFSLSMFVCVLVVWYKMYIAIYFDSFKTQNVILRNWYYYGNLYTVGLYVNWCMMLNWYQSSI